MPESRFSERTSRLTGSLIRQILSVAQRPDVISFAGGLPSPDILPELDWSSVPRDVGQYGASEGEPELRATIARQLTELGRPCKAEQVIILSGSQQGIDLISKLFIDPGTPIVLEAPTYLAALQNFRFFGARFLEVELGANGADVGQFRRLVEQGKPAFAYLIPSFQNPSGTCYDLPTRQAIAQTCDEFGLTLVEDEPYRELVYDNVDRTPITSLLERAPWIYLGTFSKTALPGLRIGYIAVSENLFTPLLHVKQASDLHSNRLGQWALQRFVSSPDFPRHLEQTRAYYRVQRDAMEQALSDYMADIADWNTPAGGLFFWVRLRRPYDMMALLERTTQKKVVFMPGEAFFANPRSDAYCMRLNFSHASAERIREGIGLLKEALVEMTEK